MRLSTEVCANPFAILSFEHKAFFQWTSSFASRQKLGIEIEGPLRIEAPYTEQLNELYWAEGFPVATKGASRQLTLEDTKNYLLYVLIPQDIREELFPALNVGQPASGAPLSEASDSITGSREHFLFGEEFEYSGMNIATKNDMVRDDYKLKRWMENLERQLKKEKY